MLSNQNNHNNFKSVETETIRSDFMKNFNTFTQYNTKNNISQS